MTRGTHKRDSQGARSPEKEVLCSFLEHFLRDGTIRTRTITQAEEQLLFDQVRNHADPKAEAILSRAYKWLALQSAALFRQTFPFVSADVAERLASAAILKAIRRYVQKRRDYTVAEYSMWWILRAYGIPIHEQWVDALMRESLLRRTTFDGELDRP